MRVGVQVLQAIVDYSLPELSTVDTSTAYFKYLVHLTVIPITYYNYKAAHNVSDTYYSM